MISSLHTKRVPFRTPACKRSLRQPSSVRTVAMANVRQAGPSDPPPDYTSLDAQPLNKAIMDLFIAKIAIAVGEPSNLTGYDAIIDLTKKMTLQGKPVEEIRANTRWVLQSMLPSWIPPAFKILFARPLPDLSNKMNAAVTAFTCQWLMGPSKVNNIPLPDGTEGVMQGVLVERCRYLEASGCVSVCINSCKLPTQEFFREDMGLDVTLEPNYDDFSCQFCFGKKPPPIELDEALTSPCFQQCPTKKRASPENDNCPRVGKVLV